MAIHRILIVEDELKLSEHLQHVLSLNDFSVFTCQTYAELNSLLDIQIKRFDAVILDRLLAGRDSADLIPKIKSHLPDVKIMILSAINTSSEKASLLNLGADDYLAKPFDSEELVARIRVLLRRTQVELQKLLGNVVLDLEKRRLYINGVDLPLTNKEFGFLKTLINAPGKIFNKAYLYVEVWEMSPGVESNVIEATVNKLRRRLEEAGASIKIKNARNVGYWVEE